MEKRAAKSRLLAAWAATLQLSTGLAVQVRAAGRVNMRMPCVVMLGIGASVASNRP
jgi:hypothetical protein